MAEDSGSKTEKATPKKRKDARKKGQVRKSTEVNVAFSCIVMFGLLTIIWPSYMEDLANIYTEYLSAAAILPYSVEPGTNEIMNTFTRTVLTAVNLLWPIMAVAMLVGIITNVAQVGLLYTTEAIKPKLSNISPMKGFKRIFSLRTVVELLKSLLKVGILGYIGYTEYKKQLTVFPEMMGEGIYTAFSHIMNTAFNIALKMSLAFVVIAAADFFYQWWKFEKDLRMTKQEIKDEYKQTEGDPQIKGRIRQKQRQMSSMRMMEAVPSADVVITNPTHYAVALKYEDGVNEAPVVVAKGEDYLARRIKEIARENGVELVENKPLAQALYAYCEPGDMIPAEFYQAVADILVYVYKQRGPGRAGER